MYFKETSSWMVSQSSRQDKMMDVYHKDRQKGIRIYQMRTQETGDV